MIQNNLLYIIIIFIIGLIINITNPKKNLKEKKIKQMYTEYTYPKYNEEVSLRIRGKAIISILNQDIQSYHIV